MNKTDIFNYITQNQGTTIPELQMKFGLSYRDSKAVVDEFVKDGSLKFEGGIRYECTVRLDERAQIFDDLEKIFEVKEEVDDEDGLSGMAGESGAKNVRKKNGEDKGEECAAECEAEAEADEDEAEGSEGNATHNLDVLRQRLVRAELINRQFVEEMKEQLAEDDDEEAHRAFLADQEAFEARLRDAHERLKRLEEKRSARYEEDDDISSEQYEAMLEARKREIIARMNAQLEEEENEEEDELAETYDAYDSEEDDDYTYHQNLDDDEIFDYLNGCNDEDDDDEDEDEAAYLKYFEDDEESDELIDTSGLFKEYMKLEIPSSEEFSSDEHEYADNEDADEHIDIESTLLEQQSDDDDGGEQ